ncbi:hypothetical protein ACQVP2_18120 [Methylobacterium aquaticum]|uniref:hypothetical protein n=1 Tax=Methylobacterium aquaticum TaxID=270351 RepID=UPI003D16BB99
MHEAQDPGTVARAGLSAVWGLIGLVLLVAIGTTINGLFQLTGKLYYAVPFGLVTQVILLIVSLNLGRDVARLVTGRSAEIVGTGSARRLRGAFLIFVYLLFFSICWFFAFSTYYEIFRSRGDDIEATATQAAQFNDLVLTKLRTSIETKNSDAIRDLTNNQAFKDYVSQSGLIRDLISRPDVSNDIAEKFRTASTKAANDRRQEIKNLEEKIKKINEDEVAQQAERDKRKRDLATKQASLNALPARNTDLLRAIEQERTGVLPPPQRGSIDAAGPAPDANPAPPRPAQSAAARIPAKSLASTLVPSKACSIDRAPGSGACLTALMEAQKALATEERALRSAIADHNAKMPALIGALDALAGQRDELRNRVNTLMSQSGTAMSTELDAGGLGNAISDFRKSPNGATLQRLVGLCRPVEDALRQTSLLAKENLSKFECRPEALVAETDRVDETRALVSAFEKRCGATAAGEQAALTVSAMRKDFDEGKIQNRDERLGQAFDALSREIIAPCLELASRAGVSTDEANSAGRRFLAKVNPRQTEFSRAVNTAGLVGQLDATPPAYLAAVFAAAQELAILLLSILRDLNSGVRAAKPDEPSRPPPDIDWALRPDDPANVAAAKKLLVMIGQAGAATLPAHYAEDEKPDIQANMHQIVRDLTRKRLAKKAMFGSSLHLSPEAIVELERRVVDYHAAAIRPEPARATEPPRQPPETAPGAAASTTGPAPPPRQPDVPDPPAAAARTTGSTGMNATNTSARRPAGSPFFDERRTVGVTMDADDDRI